MAELPTKTRDRSLFSKYGSDATKKNLDEELNNLLDSENETRGVVNGLVAHTYEGDSQNVNKFLTNDSEGAIKYVQVTNKYIAENANIHGSKIAAKTIKGGTAGENGQIATRTITGANLAEGCIDNTKLLKNDLDLSRFVTLNSTNGQLSWTKMKTFQNSGILFYRKNDSANPYQPLKATGQGVLGYKNNDGYTFRKIENDDIVNNSIDGSKIADDTITNSKIAEGTITGDELAEGCINNSSLLAEDLDLSKFVTLNDTNGLLNWTKMKTFQNSGILFYKKTDSANPYQPLKATGQGVLGYKNNGGYTFRKIENDDIVNNSIDGSKIADDTIEDSKIESVEISKVSSSSHNNDFFLCLEKNHSDIRGWSAQEHHSLAGSNVNDHFYTYHRGYTLVGIESGTMASTDLTYFFTLKDLDNLQDKVTLVVIKYDAFLYGHSLLASADGTDKGGFNFKLTLEGRTQAIVDRKYDSNLLEVKYNTQTSFKGYASISFPSYTAILKEDKIVYDKEYTIKTLYTGDAGTDVNYRINTVIYFYSGCPNSEAYEF